jgi:hypothetical protein
MNSDVEICNMALTLIGKPPINAFTEARAEAAACAALYDPLRRQLLQRSAWTFAKRREALAEVANDFAYRWRFAYARPADALTILRVMSPDLARRHDPAIPPFEVREQRVYTHQPEALCEYIFDLTNVTYFSPLFADALAHALAERLARNLTRSAKLSQEMKDAAREAFSLAVSADAAQDGPTYLYGSNAAAQHNDYSDVRTRP